MATISSPNLTTPLLIISPTTIQDNLTVAKDLSVIGTLTVGNLNPQSIDTNFINSKTITTNHLSTNSISATGSFSAKSFSGQFGSFTNLSSNGASFGGESGNTFLSKSPSTFESTLSVAGAASLTSTLAVTGASTLTGAATLSSTLAVTGASTFTGAITANGGITLTGSLSTTATSTALAFVASSATATSTLAGNLQVNNSLNITGTSTLATTTLTTLAVTSPTATTTLAGGLALETSGLVYDYQTNRVGIGTNSPSSIFHILSPTTNPQATIGYDTTNYLTLNVGSGGTTTLDAIGSAYASLLFNDPLRIATTSAFALEIRDGSSTENLLTANTSTNRLGIATSSPWGLLSLEQGTEAASFLIGNYGSSTPTLYVSGVNQNGRIGMGTSAPTAALHIQNTTSPQLTLSYDSNNYYNTQISSSGQITFTRYGSTLNNGFLFNDTLAVSTSTNQTVLTITNSNTSNATSSMAIYQQGFGPALYISRLTPYATSSAMEIVTATSSALTLTSQSGSATSTLSVYQQGTNGPIVLFTDTNASTTPAFKIAAITRDIEVREDYVQRVHSDLTALTNINDVFIYDTTKDADGGKWRNNDKAQSTSWYNETLDNTSQSCTLDTDDRCGRKEFPEKAMLVVTASDLFIMDAKDNSQWMNFDEGSTASSTMSIIGGTSSTSQTAVYALNGTIYVSRTGNDYDGGVVAIDFKKDSAIFYGQQAVNGKLSYNSTIGNRNSTSLGYVTKDATLGLVDEDVNDVHVNVVTNKTYVAMATQGGITILNENNSTAVDIIDGGSYHYKQVVLALNGTLYGVEQIDSGSPDPVLDVYYNAHTIMGDVSSDSRRNGYYYKSSATFLNMPGLLSSSSSYGLTVIPNRSNIDQASNTIYWGTSAGLYGIQEKQGDETSGSVKHYTKDYITEEMIGDIRGMLPLSGSGLLAADTTIASADASVKANAFTTDGAATVPTYTTGVRGPGLSFDNGDYICTGTSGTCADDDDLDLTGNFSVGAWIKRDSIASDVILDKLLSNQGWEFYSTTDGNLALYMDTSALNTSNLEISSTGIWYHVVGTYQTGDRRLYVDGVEKARDTYAGGATGHSTRFTIGADRLGTSAWHGMIDEPFVTAEALTPAQIKYMYEVGKKALESHTSGRITGISGADSYQQLYGTSNIVKSVSVDLENNLLYVGTNSSADAGGVSVLGLNSDSLVDIYGSDANKNDDDYTQWTTTTDYDDIVSLSVSSRYPKTIVIASEAALWTETEQFSLDKYRSQTVNPHGETLTQTNLTVNYKLEVGNELNVYGTVLGASTGGVQTPQWGVSTGKPTFRVASDGTVTVRDDILFTGRTTLTSLSNINDVFVYDTSKDSDGGEWTCNDIARATSWYNEPLNTATRGKTRCFPRKAIVVASGTTASGNIYIYDAKDNSMWMVFTGATQYHFESGNTRPAVAIFGLNGTVYIAQQHTSGGLQAYSLKADKTVAYTTAGLNVAPKPIADRNTNNGWLGGVVPSLAIANNTVNDVSAAVVNGKTYVAVATDGGVSVINETDGTVTNLARGEAKNDVNAVALGNKGELYISQQGHATITAYRGIYVKYNAHTMASNTSANDTAYNFIYWAGAGASAQPAIIGTADIDNTRSITIANGISSVDGQSNAVYVGSDVGATVLQEKQGDESNGSVKYYTKDYISEEMIGDIRGMWPLDGVGGRNGLFDASVKANTLTNNNTVTFTSSGVRGHAASFNGSNQYLNRAGDSDFNYGTGNFSYVVWVKSQSAANPGSAQMVMESYDGSADLVELVFQTNGGMRWLISPNNTSTFDLVDSSVDTYDGNWHLIVGTVTGTNRIDLYIDGELAGSDASRAVTASLDPSEIRLGFARSAEGTYFAGYIDEPMVTAETLTPAQIKRMYETGKRALEGGVEGVASSATSAHSAFRIGVASGAVPYTAGQFIGSIIQVYDGPGGATSTRFITQTASSTSDYYIQFSPDHSASIANSDTFSIGPNALQGDSNRVTSLAVDDMRDFIYIGSTSGTGTGGMVTKIALDSDTVTDVWHPSVGKQDDASQPYATASTTAISIAGNTLAIGANDTSNGGLWSEYQSETLDHKLNGPKSVFTVIDRVQTPKITTVSGLLTIGTATSTSLTIGTATTTGSTIQIKAGPSQNLLLSGDSNMGLYVSSSGNVGIGTTTPSYLTDIYRNTAASTEIVRIDQHSASATAVPLRIEQAAKNYGQIGLYGTSSSGGSQYTNYIKAGASANIADDGTYTIMDSNTPEGLMLLWVTSGAAVSSGALITFQTGGGSAHITVISQGGTWTIAGTTSDVTGTTGVDGQFTVSARPQTLEVENRTGAIRVVSWFILDIVP